MISSSILNSVTFKNLTGSYPNAWNTLQANRRHGTFQVKRYFQKFNSNHVLYLQFTSELSTSVNLKSFNGLTQIESITNTYTTSYGTTDMRYFFNFVVTLDADYLNKEVYFTATQGTDVLTSEPILTKDLTADISRGRIKYIKYTNLDRVESDLDDRFIDWSALTSTGKYMDFFIEGQDLSMKESDSTEVLEGSQSQTILSANYYSGRILKTGSIPDYMVTRLGMCSSLDIFMVNDIQYIKSGEIEQSNFGSSTLFQATINMTQKLAIGINVDNVGIIETPEIIPVETIKMYVGYVESASPNETEVKLMTAYTAQKIDVSHTYDPTLNKRFCFAYPLSYGDIVSAVNNFGFDIISGFVKTTAFFTFGTDSIEMNIWTYVSPITYVPSPPLTIIMNYKFT